LDTDLKLVLELLYNKCGLQLSNLTVNKEGIEYNSCSFYLNSFKIEHRTSKITPTKTGQFVTIWKRNNNGITEPYDILDGLDFIIITCQKEELLGQFIFPKSILVAKGILSKNGTGGKRGIRVYPPWDVTTNTQAKKTQSWQVEYFVEIKKDNSKNINKINQFFNLTTN